MKDTIASDHLSQVKRFKGRGRYELYIHNREFRSVLADAGALLPDEHLNFEVKPAKKYYSKSHEYLSMLQKYLCCTETRLKQGFEGPSAHEFLSVRISELFQKFGVPAQIAPENKDQVLNLIYRQLAEYLKASV